MAFHCLGIAHFPALFSPLLYIFLHYLSKLCSKTTALVYEGNNNYHCVLKEQQIIVS